MARHLFINIFVVVAGVNVSHPAVHRVAIDDQTGFPGRLAESEIGIAGMGAEFDKNARPRRAHDPGGKGNVAGPGQGRHQVTGMKARRFKQNLNPTAHRVSSTTQSLASVQGPSCSAP